MKNYYNELEQFSAFVDDELPVHEKNAIEERVVFSNDVKKQILEFENLKLLTKNAIKPLPESAFFESKLTQAIKEKHSKNIISKKYFPAVGFALLTVFFIAVFKFNPDFVSRFFTQQKNSIASFYKENLKPLLYAANLSNEDIFNFAMYKQLPLDATDKQYLVLGYDKNGSEYFEIISAGQMQGSNNLEKFIKALNLNEMQKIQIDSILSFYAEEIQSQVLFNKNKTVAISPKLWSYNKAIMADIFSFLAKTNKQEFLKIMPAGYSYYSGPEVVRLVEELKNVPEDEYIFFTPDSIFHDNFYFDKEQFKNDMKEMKSELRKELEEAGRELRQAQVELKLNIGRIQKDSTWKKKFKVFIDDDFCRVEIPDIDIPEIEIPDFPDIDKDINEALKNLDVFVMVEPPLTDKKFKNQKYNFNFEFGDSTFRKGFNVPNVDSIIRSVNPDSIIGSVMNGKHINIDSIMNMVKVFIGDSLSVFDKEDFKESMREFKQEMKEFQDEMRKLKKDTKRNNRAKKEPVEI